jgi:hypothetical protein
MTGAARAHWISTLHGYGAPFSVIFSSYRTSGVRGTHQGGLQPVRSSGAGHVVERFKLQPSMTVGGSSKGQVMTRLGETGAA